MIKKTIKILLKYPIKITNNIFVYGYYKINSKGFYPLNLMLKENNQRVLFLSPHVDDESIGAGGTLLKHVKKGDIIKCVYITDGGASTTELTRDQIVSTRKKEAEKVKEVIGLDEISFLDEKDGYVKGNESLSEKIYTILVNTSPDIIYSPFLIDAHNDHVATTRALIKALKKWKSDYQNIYLYEINCPISPKLINIVSTMKQEEYKQKEYLLRIFESQQGMGFNAFLLLNRIKRHLISNIYATEVFVKVNVNELERIDNVLKDIGFKHNYFRQLGSDFNLLISFIKGLSLKKRLNAAIKKILL